MTGRYRTTLTGPFPRPEALVQATRDLDRGRIPLEKGEEAFSQAEQEVLRVEADLGLDATTGGYLRWQDLFRPFSRLWTGVTTGPLTRFFETNTFFRQPVLEARPRPGNGSLAEWLPRGPNARAILPGPYTFAHLADVRYRAETPASVTLDIADALATELRALGPARPASVQFQEPLLAYAPPKGAEQELAEAYRRIADGAGGVPVSIWTYFGDAGPMLPSLARLPVDAIGFDLFATTVPTGTSWGTKGLGLGCVDPTVTTAEDPKAVAELVRAAEAALRPPLVWLGPNPPLDLLPFDSAVAKLKVLPELRKGLER